MPYDPTLYLGTATYYVPGRPPYSRQLVDSLAAEVGLDGSGRLLDVGCGPGVLTLALAPHFEEAIGLDPDAGMLAVGAERAHEAGINNIRWIQALAEDIPTLNLGTFRLVTFGQSFHWTDRERVAAAVYQILEPGGALALVHHSSAGMPQPESPGCPPIPHDAIRAVIERYLGPRRRAGSGFADLPTDPHEGPITRAGFKEFREVLCPGRGDIVQDCDGVMANYFSTSFAAPHLFGEQLDRFEAEVRAELTAHSPGGQFWDWPGNTHILLAVK